MSSINISAIISLVESSPVVKKEIDRVFLNASARGSSGVGATCINEIKEIAEAFVNELQSNITACGLSGVNGASDFTIGTPKPDAPGDFLVEISHANEAALHRSSLNPNSSGVDNIAALLNNGWNAGSYVYGIWHGEHIRSRKDFDGYHFVQDAADNFKRNYASRGVKDVEIGDKYS